MSVLVADIYKRIIARVLRHNIYMLVPLALTCKAFRVYVMESYPSILHEQLYENNPYGLYTLGRVLNSDWTIYMSLLRQTRAARVASNQIHLDISIEFVIKSTARDRMYESSECTIIITVSTKRVIIRLCPDYRDTLVLTTATYRLCTGRANSEMVTILGMIEKVFPEFNGGVIVLE